MKLVLLIGCAALIAINTTDGKKDLLCHTWRLVGIKGFGKEYRPAHTPQDEVLTLSADGTYKKLLYGQLEITGTWKLTGDSSKLMFGISTMNGTTVPSSPGDNLSLNERYAHDSIIQLTSDTLIDGLLEHFGPERKYGHDDWYYVRVDNASNDHSSSK